MILPTTSAQPSNDYTEADVQDDERVDPQAARAPSAWPMVFGLLAVPVALVIGMLWAIGAL